MRLAGIKLDIKWIAWIFSCIFMGFVEILLSWLLFLKLKPSRMDLLNKKCRLKYRKHHTGLPLINLSHKSRKNEKLSKGGIDNLAIIQEENERLWPYLTFCKSYWIGDNNRGWPSWNCSECGDVEFVASLQQRPRLKYRSSPQVARRWHQVTSWM